MEEEMARQFTATEAHREQMPLFIGLVGPSGGGKTLSALRLAEGIRSVNGGEIHLIDTENRRGTLYADDFKFKHIQFDEPFASVDYLDAIRQSAAAGASVIIVDSMSHEHEGPGGMIDFQEQVLTRITKGDESKRNAMQMLAWAEPKAARRKLLQGLTRVNASLILCFRAKETSKPGKEKWTDKQGQERTKNVVIPMGYMPIAGSEFVFEMSLSALLLPGSKGTPEWHPENPGEKMAVKIPRQFEWLEGYGQLDEKAGARLAEWAKGGKAKVAKTTPVDWLESYLTDLYAAEGKDAVDAVAKKNDAALKKLETAHPDLSKRAADALTARLAEFAEAPAADPFDTDATK